MEQPICAWELAELARSANFSRMSGEFRRFAVMRAREAGIEAARQVIAECGVVRGEADLIRIIRFYGAEIAARPEPAGLDRLAEYDEDRRQITCFPAVIDRVERRLTVAPAPFTLRSLCLAHELFHHLEAVKFGKVTRYVKLPRKILGIGWTQGVEAAREIAAHVFVQHLLDLPCSPAELVK